jgi:aryl-alcohol dehydrogenase-like predicted oxidoreductase
MPKVSSRWHPGPLDDLVPFAQRENRIVIAYSPLAQGLLG